MKHPAELLCPNCRNMVSIKVLEACRQCPHCKIDYPQKGWEEDKG